MSWEEALKAMLEGKKVRHEYFSSEEYFETKDGEIVCENGYPMRGWYQDKDWQKTGWSIHSGR